MNEAASECGAAWRSTELSPIRGSRGAREDRWSEDGQSTYGMRYRSVRCGETVELVTLVQGFRRRAPTGEGRSAGCHCVGGAGGCLEGALDAQNGRTRESPHCGRVPAKRVAFRRCVADARDRRHRRRLCSGSLQDWPTRGPGAGYDRERVAVGLRPRSPMVAGLRSWRTEVGLTDADEHASWVEHSHRER